MAQHSDLLTLTEQWSAFLKENIDARVVVDELMARTGFSEKQVFYLLMEAWAERNLRLEQELGFDEWVYPTRH
jgi:hypothetical protein